MRPTLRLPALIATLLLLNGCNLSAAEAGKTVSSDSAAASVAQTDPQCQAIDDFYWEIGNGEGVLASGRMGDDYAADETIDIASASKFIWGAYVLENLKAGEKPNDEQLSYLEMKSGYAEFNPLFCLLSKSVDSCLDARSNNKRSSSAIGRFSYGGGHDQRMAASMGLGRKNAAELTSTVMGALGLSGLDIAYKRPQPAGGLEASPAAYGKFLSKIVAGDLRIHDYLGYQPVCAFEGAGCNALSSPVKERWHYSLNHWVEDDPDTGDGAFSSPGLMGFYPWVSADRSTYGLVARKKLSKSAYWDSVQCGRKIRAAWMESH